ncbi:MAG: PAS domain S-box protein, partial [Chitinophagaceae bacterium]|nr:PAS domain S-box protein [Chitinophagaceae bacterium]
PIQHATNGKLLWLEEEVIKKIDPVSNEEVWVGMIRDISGVEFYKEYIKESEQRFKNITDSLPVMIWVADAQDQIIYTNHEAKKMFGLTDDMKVSVTEMSDWVEPGYKEIVIREWDEKRIKRVPIQVEMELKTAMGSPRYLSLKAVPRFLKNGEFIGYIGATLDLTHENNLKVQAEQTMKALRANEEKFRSLFENLELGVLEVDLNDKILYVNNALSKISGYSQSELVGKIANEIFLPNQESKSQLEAQNKFREQGKSSVYELPLKRKDGSIGKMVISGAPVFDANGNICGSVGIHWDVTKIREMEIALREQEVRREKDLSEARMQAEDQQRYELINMYIGLIRSNGKLTPKELKDLEDAIQKTIEQVRNLSRLLAPPELKDIGLRESIRELINSCSIMKKPSFKLDIYPVEDDYNLNMDKKRMVYRVVQELLNNTFKHAEAENVELKLYFDKKNFYLHYQDDGQGFDQNKIKKGIGLDSIESRIKYHQGLLKLESSPGKGSKTTITLPI